MRIKPLFFGAAGVLAILFASCSGDSSGGGDPAVAVTKVVITDKTITSLTVGEELQLSAEASPANATVKDIKWSSSDDNAAIVNSSGLVKAMKVSDSVRIYARSSADNTVYDYIDLKINAKEGVSQVTISGPKTIAGDGTAELTAEASGSDLDASKIIYTWKIISGSEYAKLSSTAGSSVTLTGNNTSAMDGNVTVKVTATCTEEGKSSTAENSFTLSVAGTSTTLVTKITISADVSSVVIGKTIALTATVEPSNATNKTLTWSSSDTNVAKVSDEGVVTGVAAGKATITGEATDGSGIKGTIDIAVTDEGNVIGTVY